MATLSSQPRAGLRKLVRGEEFYLSPPKPRPREGQGLDFPFGVGDAIPIRIALSFRLLENSPMSDSFCPVSFPKKLTGKTNSSQFTHGLSSLRYATTLKLTFLRNAGLPLSCCRDLFPVIARGYHALGVTAPTISFWVSA